MNEALKSITSTSNYPRLMDSLFSRCTDNHKDFSYDFNSNIAFEPLTALLTTRLQSHATKVFTRHGAIQVSSPLLMHQNNQVYPPDTFKKPVRFLDPSGEILQMPWDLTVPFARFMSRTLQNTPHLTMVKRFAIDAVYRRNVVGGQPKSILECDFDIVTRSIGNVTAEAEGTLFRHG